MNMDNNIYYKIVLEMYVCGNGIVVLFVCIESVLKLSLQNDDFLGKFNFFFQGIYQLIFVFDFGDF